MALELAELAAGLPMAASFAMAGGIAAFRDGRRRSLLNEAMHELRRPLQALTLAHSAGSSRREGVESSLQMAAAALARLDREINGRGPAGELTQVSMRPLVEDAVERWRRPAALAGASLELRWEAGEAELRGDRFELAQALDNLISNALRHGGSEVTIDARAVGGVLRLAILDSGRAGMAAPGRSRAGVRDRMAGRSRHGHGLRIVRRAAANHGGSFSLRRRAGGTEARLELPPGGRSR